MGEGGLRQGCHRGGLITLRGAGRPPPDPWSSAAGEPHQLWRQTFGGGGVVTARVAGIMQKIGKVADCLQAAATHPCSPDKGDQLMLLHPPEALLAAINCCRASAVCVQRSRAVGGTARVSVARCSSTAHRITSQ